MLTLKQRTPVYPELLSYQGDIYHLTHISSVQDDVPLVRAWKSNRWQTVPSTLRWSQWQQQDEHRLNTVIVDDSTPVRLGQHVIAVKDVHAQRRVEVQFPSRTQVLFQGREDRFVSPKEFEAEFIK